MKMYRRSWCAFHVAAKPHPLVLGRKSVKYDIIVVLLYILSAPYPEKDGDIGTGRK